jgi:hypothetical protein
LGEIFTEGHGFTGFFKNKKRLFLVGKSKNNRGNK